MGCRPGSMRRHGGDLVIITLTANPSHDRTVTLDQPLERGAVIRVSTAVTEPGGKGINVAHVAALAGQDVRAILPCKPGDPMLESLDKIGLPHSSIAVAHPIRTNLTLSEPDGTTTKLNEPGAALGPAEISELIEVVVASAQDAEWVVLSGSLPPDAPADLYAQIITQLPQSCRRVAVDTSGDALRATVGDGVEDLPNLIKPNDEELADLTGEDPARLSDNPERAATAARRLLRGGLDTVLLTLGASGALAVTSDDTWLATPPPIQARSTVGAGDSSLAGWLLADIAGHDTPTCLKWAVAWGSAAASLPGSTLPRPDQTVPEQVHVRPL